MEYNYKGYTIVVNGQIDGFYWRIEDKGHNYGPLYNTAATQKQAREQAEKFVNETMIPTEHLREEEELWVCQCGYSTRKSLGYCLQCGLSPAEQAKVYDHGTKA